MTRLDSRVPSLAAAQLSMLLATSGTRPKVDGVEIRSEGTPIYDLEGDVLFERVALNRQSYVDLAVAPEFGAPLVAFSTGAAWDPKGLIARATEALRRTVRRASFDEARLVAYTFPKLAVQFLKGGQEVALIECYTDALVPAESEDPNFRRIPFRSELDPRVARRKAKRFGQTLEQASVELQRINRFSPVVRLDDAWVELFRTRTEARDLHYSSRSADHQTCFELRGQETNVWCVGASVQMVLDFYRYEYTQTRLATELGLGTKANPNGLPYSRDADVVMVLENMSSKSLVAAMNTSPTFSEYKGEIKANRPLISFIPGHSRAVAGYKETTSVFTSLNYQGLLVFDPWPPNAGVITRWENFGATSYRRTFTAHVSLA